MGAFDERSLKIPFSNECGWDICESYIYRRYQSVDPEAESQWIFRMCGYRLMRAFAHQRIVDRLIVLNVAELAKIFPSSYIDSAIIFRRVKQLRIDLARADRRATKTGGVHILACTEAGRHSISELIPPLAFVLQRFIPPVAPRARSSGRPLSPRWFTPPTHLLLWRDVHERVNRVSQARVGHDCGLTRLSSWAKADRNS